MVEKRPAQRHGFTKNPRGSFHPGPNGTVVVIDYRFCNKDVPFIADSAAGADSTDHALDRIRSEAIKTKLDRLAFFDVHYFFSRNRKLNPYRRQRCNLENRLAKFDGMIFTAINTAFAAASYYHESGKDLTKALEWIQKATDGDSPRFWMVRREALI
ncbi:MAG: hypothetical protein AAF456_15005, partial [Planctomycetota bacterium]